MKKEFIWKGEPFTGLLEKDNTTEKIWKKENSNLYFITTGLPAPDQLVVFEKFEREFVFFERFSKKENLWEIGDSYKVSHYTSLLPYEARALLKPYCVDNGFQQTILVEFFESKRLKHSWKFRRGLESPWVRSV